MSTSQHLYENHPSPPREYSSSSFLPRSEPHKHRPTQIFFSICIVLHVGLVVAHLIPSIVLGLAAVPAMNMQLGSCIHAGGSTGKLFFVSSGINILIQVGGIVYLSILVWLTQQLALRRSLHNPHSFTAIHDKAGAWMGLGASAVALMNQLRLRTALGSITAISIYLCAMFGIHTTTPNLVRVTSPIGLLNLVQGNNTLGIVSDNKSWNCQNSLDGWFISPNTWAIVAGLVLSIILLTTSSILIREPKLPTNTDRGFAHIDTALDSSGLLQFTWLLANTPRSAILEPLSKVQVPSMKDLREAGMFHVTMSDVLLREDSVPLAGAKES